MKKDIQYYMSLPYSIVTLNDEYTDGTPCIRAECLNLPGCASDGTTREEAIANLEDAKRLYLETMLELGRNIPEPISAVTFTASAVPSISICYTPKRLGEGFTRINHAFNEDSLLSSSL